MKIKALYHMKEIKLKMEHKHAMDKIEQQEQARKVSSSDGREMMEEKVTLLQVRGTHTPLSALSTLHALR